MMGPRCLGPGGSAIRSSAARAPSIAAASLAECSYRIGPFVRPREVAHAKRQRKHDPGRSRSFSSAASRGQIYDSAPQAHLSEDTRDVESLLHARAQDTSSIHDSTMDLLGELPSSRSFKRHPTLQPQPDISPRLLVDYLKASESTAYKQIKAELPPGFLKIDAYLQLRKIDPQSLSALACSDIIPLIKKVGRGDLGGVLSLILEDIVGPDLSTSKAKAGNFQIYAGTEDRYKLLREILVHCDHGDFDQSAIRIFMLMLDDLIQLRQSEQEHESSSDISFTTSTSKSTAEGATITLPANFPIGETRRLIKLALHLHRPELAPILDALRVHLEAHSLDFPSAREGAQLIAYYLQPNLREFAAALDVVRALRDTNAIPQDIVDDVISEGKQYLSQLQTAFARDAEDAPGRPTADELQQIYMDVSLRIFVMKCLTSQRPKGGVQYRKAFESLMSSFRLDLVDSASGVDGERMRKLLLVPLRTLRSNFLHLLDQHDGNCLTEALFLLQRCDQRLVAMLPHADLQQFCDIARKYGLLDLAIETYSHIVKAKASPSLTLGLPIEARHTLMRDGVLTDSTTFLSLMQRLLNNGQRIVVMTLLRALHILPLTNSAISQLNLRFVPAERARVVALLARVGATEEALELFQYWSHWRYDSDFLAGDSANEGSSLRNAGSKKLADPLIERQIRLMHDSNQQVAISTSCLVSLVQSLCRPLSPRQIARMPASSSRPSDSSATSSDIRKERREKAMFVIHVFKESCTPMDWTHYRLTALAKACFIAQDVPGAFEALAKISFLRHVPDQIDIAVLLGGLMEHDPDRAVDLFIRHCSVPEAPEAKQQPPTSKVEAEGRRVRDKKAVTLPILAPMKPSARLTSLLVTRAFSQGRMDLVDKLAAFSEAVGISSRLGFTASLRALFVPGESPRKITQTIKQLLEAGWPADPAILERLAQQLLGRSIKQMDRKNGIIQGDSDAQSMPPPNRKPLSPQHRLTHAQTATYLMRLSAKTKDTINLRTVNKALDAIVLAGSSKLPDTLAILGKDSQAPIQVRGRSIGDKSRIQWIATLDEIVSLLRWTRLFDTGDDYRQSLPLWKCSNTSDGELVSAEMDDMLEQGFAGSRQRKMRASTSSAAATLSTPAEQVEEGSDNIGQTNDGANRPQADGAVKQLSPRLPNILPADLFRRLIETYLALGDVAGAAEVASWMRDEAKVGIARSPVEASSFVNRVKALVRGQEAGQGTSKGESNQILRMLAGQRSTAKTKKWWTL